MPRHMQISVNGSIDAAFMTYLVVTDINDVNANAAIKIMLTRTG